MINKCLGNRWGKKCKLLMTLRRKTMMPNRIAEMQNLNVPPKSFCKSSSRPFKLTRNVWKYNFKNQGTVSKKPTEKGLDREVDQFNKANELATRRSK